MKSLCSVPNVKMHFRVAGIYVLGGETVKSKVMRL